MLWSVDFHEYHKTEHFFAKVFRFMIFGNENDQHWKSSFLVPHQGLGVQNKQLGRAVKMGGKKKKISKGRILAYKKVNFSTFRKIFKTADFDR